ncbi:hypothetical protein Patl1_23619 [Pistacia atlantica]|uniref:Uncharacterized protein n=1 Tax=Pistacia atlantica TaxID=434234 RepID=A0ACC0ZVA9_9ROSI|nr:hypothetical protein Patl1_23619 [Pistacia atlantica]
MHEHEVKTALSRANDFSKSINLAMRSSSERVNLADSKRGMVLPFQTHSLVFNHVNYYADMPVEGRPEAWLRVPSEIDTKSRTMFVKEVMELVELKPLRNALVGLPGIDGLSTEQRKRLTVAVELAANPSIIFMDEPTSGLDARAATIVMRTVRNTVDTGRTVVCTIHQPSINIFEAFDDVMLNFYRLPLVAAPGVPKIKDGCNPATWMLEVTAPSVEAQMDMDFAEIYANSSLYQRNQELIKELSTLAPGSNDLFLPTKYSRPFFTQCKACFWKQFWSYWRHPEYNIIRFILTLCIGLLFGLVFWDEASNATGVPSLEFFYRERAARMYSALPYAFTQEMMVVALTPSHQIATIFMSYACGTCFLVFSFLEQYVTSN